MGTPFMPTRFKQLHTRVGTKTVPTLPNQSSLRGTMKTLTPLFLLFLTISQTHADTKDSQEKNLKEYDTEIIIFEDAHARYINSEIWHKNIPDDAASQTDTNAKITKNLKKSAVSKTDTTLYKNIKPVILDKEYKRINNSSKYKILFYGAWRQTGLEESKAFEININELDNAHKSNVHQSKAKNSITGQLKVVLARYLHFYSQLEYQRQDDQHTTNETSVDDTSDINAENLTPDAKQTDVLSADNNIYPIKNHRRMRSKELHYIDHPLIGMLIQINPVKKPEKKL